MTGFENLFGNENAKWVYFRMFSVDYLPQEIFGSKKLTFLMVVTNITTHFLSDFNR